MSAKLCTTGKAVFYWQSPQANTPLHCRRMLRFLDFVAQDDRPTFTPPSESESGSEQLADDYDSRGRQENPSVDCRGENKTNNLKDDIATALRNIHDLKVTDASFHQLDLRTFTSDIICSTEQEKGGEASQSRMVSPEESSCASGPLNSAANGVTSGDVHQSAGYEAIPAEPIFSSRLSQMNPQAKADFQGTVSEIPEHRRSRPRIRELLSRSDDRLRKLARVLSSFTSNGIHREWKSHDARLCETQEVVSALREIAETMVWADQHEPSLWDTFMECAVMPIFYRCLRSTENSQAGEENVSTENLHSASGDGTEVSSSLNKRNENKGHLPNGTSATTRPKKGRTELPGRRRDPISTSNEEGATEAVLKAGHAHADDGSTGTACSATARPSLQIALQIQSQVLQSLSIMIQSIFRQHSLLCLFSSNHINEILSFDFQFEDDEVLGYYMSAVKTIALKLDRGLLQLFFDPSRRAFPLYTTVAQFFDHREQMVRIAVRNITLTIYSLGDPEVLAFARRDESMYLYRTVDLLAKLSGSVARAFELLMDDGREVSRTRTRTGIFLRKVRLSDVTGKLQEIEDIFAYLGDVASISRGFLRPLILRLLSTKLFAPFFRPIASRASPRAVQSQKRWRLTNMAGSKVTSALATFDAAARCLLLAFVLAVCRSSCLGLGLIRELYRRMPEFEDRSVLHALKAMASDITGTERATFVSLCAIEAFILCDATTREMMMSFKYDFASRNPADSLNVTGVSRGSFASGEYYMGEEEQNNLEEPLLMTLLEFDSKVTPCNSVPSTPSYVPPSPSDGATPPKDLTRVMSAASFSTDELTAPESSGADGVLLTFQLGESSLREVLLSVILVVRRREVRTLRVLYSICRIFDTVGSKTGSFKLCVEVCKVILNEIANLMQSFLRNKRTTIVSMERMFDNFRSIAEQEVPGRYSILSLDRLDKILSPDELPRTAEKLPEGAGKRRRSLKNDITPPTETEDAVVLFVLLYAYERARGYHDKVEVFPGTEEPNRSKAVLSNEVRETLLRCSVDESYLEKREALEEVASCVLRHRP